MVMENEKFDLVVMGAGPGGYPAAIRAAQMGLKVALVDPNDMGGTCLNRGCIPSKALISGAEVYHKIKEASKFGITVGELSFDYEKMVERKDGVVTKIRKGLEGLIKANGITVFRGYASFLSRNEIQISGDTKVTLWADKVIVATGSEPRTIPTFPFDGKKILDSTALLTMKKLPASIAIIGGGVIGCEFASLYNLLGVKVTILEMMPTILPMEGQAITTFMTKNFKAKGIDIIAGAAVKSVKAWEEGVTVELEGNSVQADICLVAVGRVMNTSKIGLDKAGVNTDDKGNVPTNDKMETNVPGIYAIGDIASKWWLAHVATHQGMIAASNAAGVEAHMHYNAVPSVIFTHPEIASCGLSLEEALKQGYDAAVGAFPFQALGKAQATLETEGFAQIVKDKKTEQILGAQVIGYDASNLIAEMAVAIANELTIECITETIHAHPTVAESWMEAALVAFETPLHMPPKR